MSFRSSPFDAASAPPMTTGDRLGEPSAMMGQDALSWARLVWEDRESWLRTRGGVESVFMAAQLLGCRDEAVLWLRQKTRL